MGGAHPVSLKLVVWKKVKSIMECAVCGLRSAVGFCPECKQLLCEICSHPCGECGHVVCPAHLHDGRCRVCVSRSLEPVSRFSTGEPGSLDAFAVRSDGSAEGVFAKGRAGVSGDALEERLNGRMLVQSGRKESPAWLTGLMGGLAAWLLLWPASYRRIFGEIQLYLIYPVLALALGSALWSAVRLFDRRSSRRERALCLLGLLLGGGAAVAAAVLALKTR